MELKKLNVSFNKSKSGSYSGRVILPITWLRAIGVSQEDREVSVKFDGSKIIISKHEEDN